MTNSHQPIASSVRDLLLSRGESLAVAESLTGGQLAAAITAVPGASAVFLGGVVCYATRVKIEVLGVPEELVSRHGVISAECAAAMAIGVRDLLGSTWALATTGVAGPDEQEGRAAGTVFLGVAGPGGVTTYALGLTGDRAEIQRQTCGSALLQLRERVA